ncbi:MAG: ATP-binding cassette domain-containing protein [Geodermatophilaceae bacterium]
MSTSQPSGTEAGSIPALWSAGRPRLLAALVAVGFGRAAVALGAAYLVGFAFSALLGAAAEPKMIAGMALGLGVLAAAGAALVALERLLAEKLGQSYVQAVRMKLFGQISRTPTREASKRSVGGSALRFTGDLTAVGRWVSLGISRLAVAVPLLAVCLIALVIVNPLIGLGIAGVLVAGALVTLWQARALRRTTRRARRRRAQLAAHVTEHVAHSAVMQAFGQEHSERAAVRRRGQRLSQAMIDRALAIGLIRATAEATGAIATGAVVVLAVTAGQSVGPAAAAVTIVGYLVTPVRDLGRVGEYRTASTIAMEKIREVLARPRRPEPPADAPDLPEGPGALDVHDITVDGLFGPINAMIDPGQVVALVGPNGAGKSTLLQVIAALGEADAGVVRLDGAVLTEASAQSVRRAIGVVAPDVPLLRGTIMDNVRYSNQEATDDEITALMAHCGLDEVIRSLPQGAHTRVGERGARLSSGQRQRVALARALLNRPRLLLLDEADANLDPAAVEIIDRVVAEYDGTVLFVTHRPERAMRANEIWVLADGRLSTRRVIPATTEAAPRLHLSA